MTQATLSALAIGCILPALRTGPISRTAIATYASGSGDLNPVHVDVDFAREQAGLPDVIVHGMLSMGYLGRMVASWAGVAAVRSISARFEAIVNVHDCIDCTGRVASIEPNDDGALVTVELLAQKQDGTRVASGSAVVALRN